MSEKLIALGKDASLDIEVNEGYKERTEITFLNDLETSFQVAKQTEYIIKAIKDDKCCEIYLESLKNPQAIIQNILDILAISENDNKNKLSELSLANHTLKEEHLNLKQIKNDFLSLNNLKKQYKYITNIESGYAHVGAKIKIDNSNSLKTQDYGFHEYMASVTIKKDDDYKVCYVTYYSKEYNFPKFLELVQEKINNLYLKIASVSCQTNKYKVILTNEAVVSLLGTFLPMFHSKNISLKQSLLSDDFQKQVFSKKLTIIEDPMNKEGIITKLFDIEGTKTSYKELVKEGVFKTKINNLEYALKNKEEATGNAGGVCNLYIKGGNKSFKELIATMQDGIVIDEIEGLHCGVNISSGDISLQASGYMLKDQKIVKGLNLIILSTNLKELFNNIIEIGNDYTASSLDIFAPSILFQNITIAGSEE